MMDKKRRLSEYEQQQQQQPPLASSASPSSFAAKRARGATGNQEGDDDSSGTSDSVLTKADAELLVFQKDALWRELQQGKRNAAELEQQLAASQQQATANATKVMAVQAFWAQMCDESQRLVWQLEQRAKGLAVAGAAGGWDSGWETLLDLTQVDNSTRQMTDKSRVLWTRLHALVDAILSNNVSDQPDQAPLVAELEQRHRQLLQDNMRLKCELTMASGQTAQAQTLVDGMREQLERLQRTVDRLNSAAVQKLIAAANAAATAKPLSSGDSTSESSSSPVKASVSTPPTSVATTANGIRPPMSEQDKDELHYQMSLVQKKDKEIEQLMETRAVISRQMERLRAEMLMPDGSGPFEQRPLVTDLRQRHDQLLREIEQLRSLCAEQQRQMEQFLLQRQQDQEKLEREESRRKTIIEGELRMSQSETVRLRADRDNLKMQFDQANVRLKALEASIQQSRSELQNMTTENQSLAAQLAIRANGAPENDEALLAEIEAIGKALEESQKERQRLSKIITEKDEAHARLMAERAKTAQSHTLMIKEKEQLGKKVEDLTKTVRAQKDVLAKAELREKNLVQQLSLLEAQINGRQRLMDEEKRRCTELDLQLADVKSRLAKYDANAKQLQELADSRVMQLEREITLNKRNQDEMDNIRRKLEKAEKTAQNLQQQHTASLSGDNTPEKQMIKDLEMLLKCTVCKRNHKDTVITRCFHCFCRDCIDKRVETRQRKCPTCGDQFGVQDVKTIYL